MSDDTMPVADETVVVPPAAPVADKTTAAPVEEAEEVAADVTEEAAA